MTSRPTAPSQAELLATIVHDLKNPLATILGNADYVVHAPELSEDTREALAELVETAAATHHVLEDIGTLARALSGTLIPARDEVALAPLLESLARAVAPRLARLDVRLVVEVAPEVRARGDAALLRQVVRALAGLAIRRAPSGTLVTIAATVDGERTVVRVTDAGPALDEARLRVLFGTSVSLSVVKAICDAHGGTVEAAVPGTSGLVVSAEL